MKSIFLCLLGPFIFGSTLSHAESGAAKADSVIKNKKPSSKSSQSNSAKKRKVAQDSPFTAIAVDEDFDPSSLGSSGARVYQRPTQHSEVPAPQVRDGIFYQAGFTYQELSRFDHLDRDMLYLRCLSSDSVELAKRYQHFAKEKLFKLKRLCK